MANRRIEEIEGIGPATAELLEVNESKKPTRRVPQQKEFSGWIAEAGELPSVVTH